MKASSGKTKRRALALLFFALLLALIVLLRLSLSGRPLPQATPVPSATPPWTAQPVTPAPTEVPPTPAPTPAPTPHPAPKGYTEESYRLVSDMVFAYADREEEAAELVAQDLQKLRGLDGALADFWEKLMALWHEVNTSLEVSPGVLPDGLPEDDSLCIVVLGFQLEAYGGMSPELEGRCEVALASAQKYPNALIAVTGGGTAWQNRAATEAGVMAEWLTARGVAPERILVEDASLTTGENAVFTTALLREKAPQVTTLAIVSSDYHLPLGVLLFQECALLREYETGSLPFTVAANAAWDTYGLVRADTPMMQRSYLWSIANPKY